MHFIWLLILLSGSVWAHQSSLTPDGKEIFWANPDVPLAVHSNTSDLSDSQVRSIINNSMNQWNLSSSAKVNSASSSNNEIKFVSNFPYGRAVIGVTEISYNNAGAISKANIILNDDYKFHSQPGIYPSMEVFLGDVVTHELGHLFGLSHSEVLDASMFYSSFSGQSSLGYDDKTGIRKKYDRSFGRITGTVRGGNHIGVLGTHVQAISRRTGKASAVISDENGNFELGGLDTEDTYYLYTSPIKNTSSLPGYFANVQTKFCPASYVGSFFSKCGGDQRGRPQGISLTQNRPDVDVGVVTINCDLKTDLNYNTQKLKATFNPITIFSYDPQSEKVEQAFVGWFQNPTVNSWSTSDKLKVDLTKLQGTGLEVKFSIISFPLGTQLEYRVGLKNNAYTFVTNKDSLVLSPLTRTYDTDFEYTAPLSLNAADNVFEISISSRKLGSSYLASTFPSFETFSSSKHHPYLLIVSLSEKAFGESNPIVNTESFLSDNSSCLDAPYTHSVTKNKEPSTGSALVNEQSVAGAAASCGTIDPPGSGPGSSLPLMTLGFILALVASSALKSHKKFLS